MSNSPALHARCAALLFLFASTAWAQGPHDLLSDAGGAQAVTIGLDTPVRRARQANFDAAVLREGTEPVRIEAFPGEVFEFAFEAREELATDEFTWTGRLVDDP